MDLDRTLIPNGPSPDDGSLKELKEILVTNHITPIFVTARRAESVSVAMIQYNLPEPAYLIGQVGTTLHKRENNQWNIISEWNEEVHRQTPRWNRENLVRILETFPELEPQPKKESNSFKISYFLKDITQFIPVTTAIKKSLQNISTKGAELIASKDFNAKLAYIDILPKGVHKRSALDFLCKRLSISKEDILFAGDSENDLSILLSSYKTIIVANAEKELKLLIHKEKGQERHFTAQQCGIKNGNYASGILQGLRWYKWI